MTRVLIADDDLDILESTAALLESSGFEVETESQAANILRAVAATRPNVLLQDIHMPGLDLNRLIGALRANRATAHTAVVLFSADEEGRELSRRLNVDGFLLKPFNPEHIDQDLADAAAHT